MEMNRGAARAEENEIKPRMGTFNLERRRFPRFSVDLPLEYTRIQAIEGKAGRAINASEGGLLIYLPERVDIGEQISVRLFFHHGSKLHSIAAFLQVVWIDLNLGEGWGEYRCGARFADISPDDLQNLRGFLRSLAET